ncbi:hypothetical protein H4R33_002564 [Dimargaris cristalligena]|nr:hypothetical protein H4R33_002564 [Dimargaris cristalligena]
MVFFTPVSYLVDMTHRVFPLSEAVTSRLPFVSTFITTTTTTSSSSSSPALPARPSEAPKPLFVPGKVEAAVTVALEAVHKDSEGARDVALQLYLVALESLAQAIQPGQQDILPATHLARGISALQPSPSSTPVYASAGSNRRGPWQRRVADSPEPAVSPAPNDPTPAALAFVGGLFYHLLTLPTTLGQRWLLSSSTATSTSTTTIPTPLTTCPPRATWIDITGEQESVSAGSLSSEEESTAVGAYDDIPYASRRCIGNHRRRGGKSRWVHAGGEEEMVDGDDSPPVEGEAGWWSDPESEPLSDRSSSQRQWQWRSATTPSTPVRSLGDRCISLAQQIAITLKRSPIPTLVAALIQFTLQVIRTVDQHVEFRQRLWEWTKMVLVLLLEWERRYLVHQRLGQSVTVLTTAVVRAVIAYRETQPYYTVRPQRTPS